jgi:hypothetical protein
LFVIWIWVVGIAASDAAGNAPMGGLPAAEATIEATRPGCRRRLARHRHIRRPQPLQEALVGPVVSLLASLLAADRPPDLGEVALVLLVGGPQFALELVGQVVAAVGAELGDKRLSLRVHRGLRVVASSKRPAPYPVARTVPGGRPERREAPGRSPSKALMKLRRTDTTDAA